MKRWIPFAIALYALLPFALWLGFSLAGLGGGLENLVTAPEGMVLTLASLPLAGLFWIQNLRQIGDSIGGASRMRVARRVAAAMPALIAAIGTAGIGWLALRGTAAGGIALTGLGVAVMAGFGWAAARAPASPDRPASATRTGDPREGDRSGEAFLWFVLNGVLVVGSLCTVYSPLVLLWVAAGLVPVVFAILMAVAAWGCRHA